MRTSTKLLLFGGGGAPTVDPSTYSLNLWVDPSDFSLASMAAAADGTGAVVADGDVQRINNKGTAGDYFVSSGAPDTAVLKDVGGLRFLRFSGVNSRLVSSSLLLSDVITASTFDMLWAGRVNAITTDAANLYQNDQLWSDIGGYIGLYFRTGKIGLFNYDGSEDGAPDDYVAGDWFVAHLRHESGTLSLTVNNRSTVSVASGDTQSLAGKINIGSGFDGGVRTECDLAGGMSRKTLFSAPELSSLRGWLGSKVGLVL